MPRTSKDTYTNIILLSFMGAAAVIFTQLMKVPVKKIVLANTGLIFYFLYLKSNSYGFRFRTDYIQSGEGSLAMTTAVLCYGFLPAASSLAPLMMIFTAMTIFEYCLIRVINPRGFESLLYGTYINALSLVILGLLIFQYRFLDRMGMSSFISGFLQSRELPWPHVLIMFFAALSLLLLLFRVNPELLLFSHGRRYFTLTGMRYGIMRSIMIAARGFFLSITILTLGFTAGIGNYYVSEGKGVLGQLEVLLFSVLYTHFILILMEATSVFAVIVVSAIFTYVIYILNQRNSAYIYDRNQ